MREYGTCQVDSRPGYQLGPVRTPSLRPSRPPISGWCGSGLPLIPKRDVADLILDEALAIRAARGTA
jgi:hypothetical protein